jgi:septum formation protein
MKKTDLPLILASASPRRKEILEAHGFEPVIIPPDVDESAVDESLFTPQELTMHLADLKATFAFNNLGADEWPEGCLVLGVDTIVYKNRIIGKPKDEADALYILRSLRNTVHEVVSGVCVIRAAQAKGILAIAKKTLFCDITKVRFGDYSDDEILAYIRANPPYDKSGSYAVQSDWKRNVLEIDGDVENVIGLPFRKFLTMLRSNMI